eukprot:TRINITY_DN474_c0_g1_i1.p1 TRINITY_DN474_c0_g1~~TRINITY_DN474_c0_g1_i1.p1  ORF type:complete len:623 (-),score=136.92 TRINITY_DN474_c0_g1_i1:97-1965(-)
MEKSQNLNPEDIVLEEQLTTNDEGSFGNVWRGKCFGGQVAIKVPKTQKLSENELDEIKNEILTWSTHTHPHIVLFMGACMKEGNIRIVVELMDGDLLKLIGQNKSLTLIDLLDFARQAASGMEWLHGAHIIHRDLKPANMLFKKTGESTYVVKIGDFGLSVVKKDRPLTQQKGSPLYAAPELLAGMEYSQEVDVYSFGISLWEIVTRCKKLPYYDLNYQEDFEVFKKHVIQGKRPSIDDVDRVDGLRELITDCWHPEPEKRPSFKDINIRLRTIMISSAISDPEGRKFWLACDFPPFPDSTVPLLDFLPKLYSFINYKSDFGSVLFWINKTESSAKINNYEAMTEEDSPYETFLNDVDKNKYLLTDYPEDPKVPENEEVYSFRCLCALLSIATEDSQKKKISLSDRRVSIIKFGSILKWFGPLVDPPGTKSRSKEGVIKRIKDVLKLKYFHGDISSEEARRRLRSFPEGTFLMRFSGEPGMFVISRVSEGKCKEGRILFVAGQGFTVDRRTYYSSLSRFVTKEQTKLGINSICAGSKYADFFTPITDETEESDEDKEETDEKEKKEKKEREEKEKEDKKRSKSSRSSGSSGGEKKGEKTRSSSSRDKKKSGGGEQENRYDMM